MVSADEAIMHRALRLAERGRGQTAPNPMVGAVVVDDEGVIVGDGYHERAGLAHAEVRALDRAGERARGATLYCTLEPCCHTGRTEPCVERIAAAGIRHVVAATVDPNPLVNGGGAAWLREHGIDVTLGVAGRAAARQNVAFFTRVREHRPFVIAKAAVSLDGYIAAHPGARTEISGPVARRSVQRLRAEVDAIGIGVGTLMVDDPLLTARDVFRARPLTRVVFDRRLRTSPRARLFTSLDQGPIVVVTADQSITDGVARVEALRGAGAQVEAVGVGGFQEALTRLADLGISSLLLEGGAAMHAAAWDAHMIDRVVLYIAPMALGGNGVPLFAGRPFSVRDLHDCRVEPCGDDVLIEGDVHRIG
jgi:diaminohydroxyphosphoribosylaminopyrimidine deaminase / 5-amino-6-(5-phosphoribosylamino)uracil reductase